jgi:hypothetical protein
MHAADLVVSSMFIWCSNLLKLETFGSVVTGVSVTSVSWPALMDCLVLVALLVVLRGICVWVEPCGLQ